MFKAESVALRLLVPLLMIGSVAGAQDKPKTVRHYVFFGGERDQIRTDSLFLDTKSIEGAQVIYPWRLLESGKDEYDFSAIRDNLAFLTSKGKKLWIQLQDVTFEDRINIPRYLLEDPAYHGGAVKQYSSEDDNDSTAKLGGWVARRWDPAVQERFHKLLAALGKEFDGKITGINLPETSVEFGRSGRYHPEGYSVESYRRAIVTNFKALKKAFPKSIAMQYANFMPGEWRPDEDKGILSSIYDSAKVYNVAVGGPDLLPYRRGQVKGSYPLIREVSGKIPTGIAVQHGNLAQKNPKTEALVTPGELYNFAKDELRVDFIFWGREEPYYSRDVIPALRR